MAIKHFENWGGDHITVGVEIPNTENFWPVNHVYGIHEIDILYTESLEKFTF